MCLLFSLWCFTFCFVCLYCEYFFLRFLLRVHLCFDCFVMVGDYFSGFICFDYFVMVDDL